MVANLDDIVCLKMVELAGRIAGAASIWPVEVLPLLSELNEEDLTDTQVCKYLQCLKTHFGELKTGGDNSAICVQVAEDLGLLPAYVFWLTLVEDDPLETVKQSIRDIQDLKTTLTTLIKLKPFINAVEEGGEWR